ncbi:MAG: DUF2029 domain-containing protein [Chitinivibrionales bacterium]|nr:DUF2029 domain-containing protein [Chitinivibrionales bacterium]
MPSLRSDSRNWLGHPLPRPSRRMTALRYAVTALIALALPPLMALVPRINSSDSLDSRITHLLGLAGTLFLLWNGFAELRRTARKDAVRLCAVVCAVLVGFHTLHFLSEFSTRSIDYLCYQTAAERVVAGADPYFQTGYLYPPLLAQIMALPQLALIQSGGNGLAAVWDGVFYLYQFCQFFLLLAGFVLVLRLFTMVRPLELVHVVGITLLFLVNNPVWRTLEWNQINLWVLVCVLLFLVWDRRRPFASGLALSFGVFLKLYPALLVVPLVRRKNYRALAGLVVGCFALLGVSVLFPGGAAHWKQFVGSMGAMGGGTLLRDNSVHSLVYNTVARVLPFVDRPAAVASVIATAVSIACVVTLCVVMFGPMGRGSSEGDNLWLHSLTLIAMLVVSPMVWTHHFVLVLPAAVYAAATFSGTRLKAVLVSLALILLIPTFDLYPLSYHRIAGLLLLGSVLLAAGTGARSAAEPDARDIIDECQPVQSR